MAGKGTNALFEVVHLPANFMKNQKILSRCPLCGGRTFLPVAKKRYVIKGFSSEVTHNYSMCSECEFIFTRDPLSDKALATYYSGNKQERRDKPDAKESQYIEAQLNFLTSGLHIPKERVLEFGANNGSFLDGCRARGFSNLYFSEFNADSRKILSNKPYLKDFNSIPKRDRSSSFDLIVLLHTLEHIVNPRGFVGNLKGYLKEGGVIFVEVPDFTFYNADTDALIFEHVNFFSENTLRHLFLENGLTPISSQISLDRSYPACTKYVCRMVVKKSADVPKGVRQRVRFIQRNENERTAVYARINRFLESISSDQSLGIYSASWLTEDCLRNTNLSLRNVVGLYDRDKKKWGTTVGGITVHEPQKLLSHNVQRLLILNEGYEMDIKRDLKELGFPEQKISGWSEFVGKKS
jgi:2-polyprenyl-3-methyl-5-hydroxy-6-metoxy-1,4-benzoquinol methylase